MKRIASIDIGTNTALLLIADVKESGEIYPIAQEEKIVRLGEDVDKSGILKQGAMVRTLIAIEEYVVMAEEFNAKRILISGTSAVRDAENRQNLIDAIKNEFGITMQVLTGEEEARLTYFGALSNKQKLQGEVLLMDIGGGSTEFILGTRQKIQYAISLDIGSVRLTERFINNDPVTTSEFGALRSFIRKKLIRLLNELPSEPENFLGVAGTITTLAAMQLQLQVYTPSRIENFELSFEQIEDMVNDLKVRTLFQKKKIPGLKPERADVILAGSLILLESMRNFSFTKTIVSERGLRFGLILKALGKV